MPKARSIAAIAACIACLYAAIICTQIRLSKLSASSPTQASMAYVPESEKIRPWLMGFHGAYADYLWIRTTIYFGSHISSDKQFPWLMHMVDMVTRLNPRFYPAYEFGGLMYSKVCGNPMASLILLQRGISANLEKKWKLYFYLGMLYHEQFHDNGRAALYTAIASQMPGAPALKLASLSAALFEKDAAASQDGRFLSLLWTASENPEVRRFLFEKLQAASGVENTLY